MLSETLQSTNINIYRIYILGPTRIFNTIGMMLLHKFILPESDNRTILPEQRKQILLTNRFYSVPKTSVFTHNSQILDTMAKRYQRSHSSIHLTIHSSYLPEEVM